MLLQAELKFQFQLKINYLKKINLREKKLCIFFVFTPCCFHRSNIFLSAWRIHQNSPTGCLQHCSAQTLCLLSPLSTACCLREKRVKPSSPARTQTTPACPPSSPAQATAEHRPPTDTARVSAPADKPTSISTL